VFRASRREAERPVPDRAEDSQDPPSTRAPFDSASQGIFREVFGRCGQVPAARYSAHRPDWAQAREGSATTETWSLAPQKGAARPRARTKPRPGNIDLSAYRPVRLSEFPEASTPAFQQSLRAEFHQNRARSE